MDDQQEISQIEKRMLFRIFLSLFRIFYPNLLNIVDIFYNLFVANREGIL